MVRFIKALAIGALLLGSPLVIAAFVTDPTFRAAWLSAAVIATVATAGALTIGDRVIGA